MRAVRDRPAGESARVLADGGVPRPAGDVRAYGEAAFALLSTALRDYAAR